MIQKLQDDLAILEAAPFALSRYGQEQRFVGRRESAAVLAVIYRKTYEHGLGTRAGETVTFSIPAGATSFRANVAIDDAEPDAAASLEFVARLNGKEVWRSRRLKKFESQIALWGFPARERSRSWPKGLRAHGPTGAERGSP